MCENFSNMTDVCFPGFKTASIFIRTIHKKGGVAIFIKDDLDFKPFDMVNRLSRETICEVAAVTLDTYNIVILVVYRSPKYNNINEFLIVLQNILELIFSVMKNYSIVLCGDFNIDLLEGQSSIHKSAFCNILSSFGLRTIVNEITRPGINKLGTCIDNVATSLHHDRISAFVLPTTRSDHDAIICNMTVTLNDVNVTSQFSQSVVRPINDWGKLYFHSLITNVNWLPVYAQPCIDDMFRTFLDLFLSILDTALPIKCVLFKPKIKRGWFNDDLRQLKQKCMMLFDLYRENHDINIKHKYLILKRDYIKQIKLAKCKFNSKFIESSHNKSKAIWSVINDSLGTNNKPYKTINTLSAERFNDYFVDKIDCIINNIKPSNHDFSFYLEYG